MKLGSSGFGLNLKERKGNNRVWDSNEAKIRIMGMPKLLVKCYTYYRGGKRRFREEISNDRSQKPLICGILTHNSSFPRNALEFQVGFLIYEWKTVVVARTKYDGVNLGCV